LDLDFVTEDDEVGGLGSFLLEARRDSDREVVDLAAAETTDVVVAPDVAVEAGGPGNAPDLADDALGGEALEVPVDRAEADPRQLAARLRVNPGRRGMVHGGPHHGEDGRALFGTPARHN
jgi:hypothetical protein